MSYPSANPKQKKWVGTPHPRTSKALPWYPWTHFKDTSEWTPPVAGFRGCLNPRITVTWSCLGSKTSTANLWEPLKCQSSKCQLNPSVKQSTEVANLPSRSKNCLVSPLCLDIFKKPPRQIIRKDLLTFNSLCKEWNYYCHDIKCLSTPCSA